MNHGKICISICARTAAELYEEITRAESLADLIEIRFDCLDPGQLDLALEGLPKISKRYLITYRPSEQGGKRVLPLSTRIMFWRRAVKALGEHDFLADHEADLDFPFGFRSDRLIRSQHYFGESPDDLRPAYFELADINDEIVKIAAVCNDITDTIKVWKLIVTAKTNEGRVIPIAMGEAGKWTRILGPAFGGYLTYASLDTGGESAPGQITASDLIDVFRVRELDDKETLIYGIVAGNTSYSVSPWMHNAAFKAAGMNHVFLPLQVADLDAFVRRMVIPESREIDLNFSGFSVTNPHKQAIIPLLDEIDETARKIGAVNTVKIEGDRLYGYNTDAPGFIAPLKLRLGDLKGSQVAVVGAGGAARACLFALKQEGAKVKVLARNINKAQVLAEEFDCSFEELGPASVFDADLLVNTTPLGTKGEGVDETIATADRLGKVKFVYDLVYNPAETRLLREAKVAGVPALGGLEMLIAQGAKQFEIWTGEQAYVDEMAMAVRTKLEL